MDSPVQPGGPGPLGAEALACLLDPLSLKGDFEDDTLLLYFVLLVLCPRTEESPGKVTISVRSDASTGLLVGARDAAEDPRSSPCETFALEVSLFLVCSTCSYPAAMLGPQLTGAICLTLLSVSPPLSLALGEPSLPVSVCFDLSHASS